MTEADVDLAFAKKTLTEARTQTMYDLDVAIVDTFAVGAGVVAKETNTLALPNHRFHTLHTRKIDRWRSLWVGVRKK